MNRIHNLITFLLLLSFIISSCASFGTNIADIPNELNYAETVFQVRLDQPLISGEDIYVEILDEVTGIAINPQRFKMDAIGSAEYAIRIPFAVGSLIRYRYLKKGGQTVIEKDTHGEQVQYRLHKVTKPAEILDLITSWDNQTYSGETGEVSGYIYDQSTEIPLGEILVSINGMQTYTSFDGYYEIKNIPLGEFNITALHPNGLYDAFQQKAVIAKNSITPATFGMQPSQIVQITFEVDIPEDTNPLAEVKLLGNILDLGNSFTQIDDGSSNYSSLAPSMEKIKDHTYRILLRLPAGLDLKYKYSLGNGFINAEHDSESNYTVRQLIIPEKNQTIHDHVASWYSIGFMPVNFFLRTPYDLPQSSSLSIQVNPFIWMQPIPMWRIDDDKWTYALYSPLEYLDQSQYRFCLNDQCGIADDNATKGKNGMGYLLQVDQVNPTTIDYQIPQWAGRETDNYAINYSLPSQSNPLLIKGFEFDASNNKYWLPYIDQGLINAGVSGGNWIFLNPSWSFDLSGNAGFDPNFNLFSTEIRSILDKTNDAGLGFALFPQLVSNISFDEYWGAINPSYNWWQKWFSNYKRFILNYVDYSNQYGINTIVIGGNTVSPAFPNGKLPNGNFSNTPYDFHEKWSELIAQIRSRYTGQIGFALPYSANLDQYSDLVKNADFIYLEFSSPLAESTTSDISSMRYSFSEILNKQLDKLYAITQKPIIFGIEYFSIDGAAANCANLESSCKAIYENGQKTDLLIDLNEQADIYSSILLEVISRPYFVGFISKGYNPAVTTGNASSSVHGKPAMQVLSFFFNSK